MECLKNNRLAKKYSFNKMAKELGISKTYYWQLENSQRRISYEMAIKIAQVFGKKPDDIFYEDFIKELGNEKE